MLPLLNKRLFTLDGSYGSSATPLLNAIMTSPPLRPSTARPIARTRETP
jgi:hypothetical protein